MKVPFGKTRSRAALPGLDRAYQQQLAALTQVRRAAATAATARKQLELQLGLTDQPLAALRDQYAAAQEKERRFFAASQRLQRKIDEFRSAKEASEAAYVAAQDAVHATQAEISDRA
jgi:predicted  nucleic acid-binding Zn-ribbon protein